MRLGPLDAPDYARLPMPHMSVEALPLIGRHYLPVFVGAFPDGGTASIQTRHCLKRTIRPLADKEFITDSMEDCKFGEGCKKVYTPDLI